MYLQLRVQTEEKTSTPAISDPNNRNISYSHPIVIGRSEFNSCLTVSIFFVEMDEGRPGLGSPVTELLPCSNLLYHIYIPVFFIALFPKAVFNISNVSCLGFCLLHKIKLQTAVQGQSFCLFRLSVSRAFVWR